ncbi:hypothetical protein [Nitrosomonas supralitoralis]|nr:hypothetical protein [Nitrosomonas supralitoralis]
MNVNRNGLFGRVAGNDYSPEDTRGLLVAMQGFTITVSLDKRVGPS